MQGPEVTRRTGVGSGASRGPLRAQRAGVQSGFTLTEMMVVVAILGVLSAVAVMSFQRYTLRVRVGEAYALLGQIKARQEVYRAEFSQYDPALQHPAGNPGRLPQVWDPAAAGRTDWLMMGVRPDRDVYFVYRVTAGAPGSAVTSPDGTVLPGYPNPSDDFWFVAEARGDLDGDGVRSMFELCSLCRSTFVAETAPYEYEGR
ncbi:MAG: prepilin-type N-terminal cleavage/methylation domain-containing protein [Deltaproteobacteria bacterium]|nr:prepilin-type N-terminal cleavage/methylation domain-containing protein [Deltaproteobacteria bacterium]